MTLTVFLYTDWNPSSARAVCGWASFVFRELKLHWSFTTPSPRGTCLLHHLLHCSPFCLASVMCTLPAPYSHITLQAILKKAKQEALEGQPAKPYGEL